MSETRDRLERLLADGPDTQIRTTWHDGIEYWEIPADEMRSILNPQEKP